MTFSLLGPLSVLDEAGGRVAMPGNRVRILLAALLVQAGTPIPLDALAEAVWDGEPPEAYATTLRSHVRRLRAALGPRLGARISTHGPGYVIAVFESELDILRFEALARRVDEAVHQAAWDDAAGFAADALGLWRATPLIDLPSQCLRDQVVPRLDQLRIQLLEHQAEADLRRGRPEHRVPGLRELTLSYPLRERFHEQLIVALVRSGRRAEALAAYQDARRTLVEQLGVEPGPALSRLHASILAGAEEPQPSAPIGVSSGLAHGGARPGGSVPRQLPGTVGHFTGRRSEIAALTGRVEQAESTGRTVVISAIDGMAGIGKTALAVHAAHRLAEQFPDGQLFLDLHGYTQGRRPRTADEALDWMLRALGVPPERIPQDGEQAAALYRQCLSDTRTLIVLDNAATEAQVRPLLPGGGSCLVLVTSRRRLKGLDDAHNLSLDLLSPPEAVALLRAVAGPDRIAAKDPLAGEVAGLCGYLPLALRIAGALLRHRPVWPLEHLARRLRDQHGRVTALSDGERELAAVFDLSYASLRAPHQNLWRRLGLVPGPDLDAYGAAALVESEPAAAAGLLEDLVDHNLLSEHAPGRYRMHDLLRAHARALAAAGPAPENEAALDRLLHYYARTAQSASAPIARYPRPQADGTAPAHTPALTDPDTARAWLRTEHPNLDAAFTHAHTHGRDEHAIALAAGLAEILQTDGPWPRALEIHQSAATTAELARHPAAHAAALNDLGRVQQATGDYPSADKTLTQALELYRALGHRHGEAGALTELGRVRQATGDYPGADDAHIRALELYRVLGSLLGEAAALANSGRARALTGNYPGAGDALTRALELYRTLGRRDGEAGALTDLGLVRRQTGDYAGADDAHTRALELYRALGHRPGEASALIESGRVRQAAGDFSGAGDALARALELFCALGHRHGEAYALLELGRVRLATGDFTGAGDALTRAMELYRALGNQGNEAVARNYYAATLAATGQRPQALALYQQALTVHRELDKPDDEAVSLEGIAEQHLATGNPTEGVAYLNQALEVYQRLGMAPDMRRVQDRLDRLSAP